MWLCRPHIQYICAPFCALLPAFPCSCFYFHRGFFFCYYWFVGEWVISNPRDILTVCVWEILPFNIIESFSTLNYWLVSLSRLATCPCLHPPSPFWNNTYEPSFSTQTKRDPNSRHTHKWLGFIAISGIGFWREQRKAEEKETLMGWDWLGLKSLYIVLKIIEKDRNNNNLLNRVTEMVFWKWSVWRCFC